MVSIRKRESAHDLKKTINDVWEKEPVFQWCALVLRWHLELSKLGTIILKFATNSKKNLYKNNSTDCFYCTVYVKAGDLKQFDSHFLLCPQEVTIKKPQSGHLG